MKVGWVEETVRALFVGHTNRPGVNSVRLPNIYLVVAWERLSRQRTLIYDIVGLRVIGPKVVDSDFHINFVVVVSGNDLKPEAPSPIVTWETTLATSNPQGAVPN